MFFIASLKSLVALWQLKQAEEVEANVKQFFPIILPLTVL